MEQQAAQTLVTAPKKERQLAKSFAELPFLKNFNTPKARLSFYLKFSIK